MTERNTDLILEEIASSVVMADPSDKESIETLLFLIGELKERAEVEENEHLRAFSSVCSALVEGVEEKADEEVAQALLALGAAISDMQKAQREAARNVLKNDDAEIAADEGAESRDNTDESTVEAGSTSAGGETESSNVFELPPWVDEEVFQEFLANQTHVLEEIEGNIFGLERGDGNCKRDLLRKIHTLKGEAGVVGLEDLESVCHGIEDFLDECKSKQQSVDALFSVKDWIERAVRSYAARSLPNPRGKIVVAGLVRVAADAGDGFEESIVESELSPARDESIACDVEPSAGEVESYIIDDGIVKPLERDEDTVMLIGEFLNESDEGLTQADDILMNAEKDGTEPEKINAIFRAFHTIKGVAGFLELDEVASLAHTTETLLDQIRDGQQKLEDGVLDLIFDATAEMRKLLVNVRESVENSTTVAKAPGLSDLLDKLRNVINDGEVEEEPIQEVAPGLALGTILTLAPSMVAPDVVAEAVESQKESGRRLGEELVAKGVAKPKEVARALRAQKRADNAQATTSKIRETVKVDLERVDSFVEMIGELVIVESMVVHHPEIANIASLEMRNYLSQLGKITRDLQDVGMRMRMVPVRSVFQKMARMVRDLSRKSGKRVKMEISGESTEMDRSMVERIADPLVHMIRNSVDHGIEASEQDRLRAGKDPVGCVHLSAYHEGGSIIIEIKDDGRGLNHEAILKKARNQGIIQEGDKLDDNEINNLIFAPGFSTAAQVTDISGRGVGMDVVKKNIDSMRGRVSIETGAGAGTAFKIIMPLTLAIIEGMLVLCGTEKYIVPTLSIIESIQPDPSMFNSFTDKGELINVRGEIVPLVRLGQVFAIEDAEQDPSKGLVVIVEGVGQRFGLLVDELLTQQQVVIKTMGDGIGQTEFVSGAAILSDGRVGLILNIDELGGRIEARAKEARRRTTGVGRYGNVSENEIENESPTQVP
ncbi:MAG: chemotaxis protein CheA [Deltaproteobacteria bacterium]|nr:chemotaxis protein CheA [Deltaproteobacteria bacterium]